MAEASRTTTSNNNKNTALPAESKADCSSCSNTSVMDEKQTECPICRDKLPLFHDDRTPFACCGVQACKNTCWKGAVIHNVHTKCPVCGTPIPTTNKGMVAQLQANVDKGRAWAQVLMACWHYNGEYGVKRSMSKALKLYKKAAAQAMLTT